jgi:hypothetical protein
MFFLLTQEKLVWSYSNVFKIIYSIYVYLIKKVSKLCFDDSKLLYVVVNHSVCRSLVSLKPEENSFFRARAVLKLYTAQILNLDMPPKFLEGLSKYILEKKHCFPK